MKFSTNICFLLLAIILVLAGSLNNNKNNFVFASPWTIAPSPPIPGTPFRVTDGGPMPPAGTYVFISKFTSCNTTDGALTMLNPRAATFTIALSDTTLYLCLSTTPTPQLLHTITLQKILLYPGWATPNIPTEVTVSPTLPAGAVIEFHNFASCATPVTGSGTVDGTSHKAILPAIPAGSPRFPCAKFTSTIDSSVQNILLDKFQAYSGLGFFPNETVINKAETFLLSGISQDGSRIRWATNNDCTGVVAEHIMNNYAIATTIAVARGIYYFCWDSSGSGSQYLSLGTMQVKKYSSLPTTMFVGSSVSIQLTDDSPFTTSFKIADVNCGTPVDSTQHTVNSATGIQVGTPFTWAAVAKFYVCVAETTDTNSVIRADQIDIVDKYVASLPSPVTRAVRTTVTADTVKSPASSVYFASTDTACSTQCTNFTTSLYTGFLVMPSTGSCSTISSFTLCAFTEDKTSYSAIATGIPVKDFTLQYNVPVQTINVALVFDGATPFPVAFYLSAGTSCGDKSSSLANYTSAASLQVQVNFPQTGDTSVCYESTSTMTSKVGPTLAVVPVSYITPSAVFAGATQTVSINYVPETGSILMMIPGTDSCPTYPGASATFIYKATATAAGTHTWNQDFATVTTYRLCVSYSNTISGSFFQDIGILNVVTATADPAYFVLGSVQIGRIVIPASYGPVVVERMYLGTSSACTDGSPTLFPTSTNGTAMVTPDGAIGTRYACFHTANMSIATDYGNAGNVTVFPQISVTYVETYGGVQGVPFHFTFPTTWGYIPSDFQLSTDPNSCASVIASGNFNSVTGTITSPILLTQTSLPYSLCVSSPTTTGFAWLRAGQLIVNRFAAVSSTFILGVTPTINTNPDLTTNTNHQFFLMASSTCVGATRYTLSTSTALPLTTPTGTSYYLCVEDASSPTWVAGSKDPVKVVPAFSATLPSPIKGEVPFTATIMADHTGGSNVRVYLKNGLNQQCNGVTDVTGGLVLAYFNGTSPNSVVVTVPHRTNVTLCAFAMDGTTSAPVASIVPLPYTEPSEIVASDSAPVTILLGDGSVTVGSKVYFTNASDCTYNVLGPYTVVTGGSIDLPLPSSYANNEQLFVCLQAPGGGSLTLKDWVYTHGPLGANITVMTSGYQPWAGNCQYWPGQPMIISAPPSSGSNPYLSHSRSCSAPHFHPQQYGVFPSEGENTTYYVCLTTVRGTAVSSPDPLTVCSFSFTPAIGVTDINLTGSYFFPPLPRFVTTNGGIADPYGGVYFSRNVDCSSPIAGPWYANITSAAAPLVIPGADGIIYTCIYPGDGSVVKVDSHMFYARAPTTIASTYPIWGLPYCLSVTTPTSWRQMEGLLPDPGTNSTRRFFMGVAGTMCKQYLHVPVRLNHLTEIFCLETDTMTPGSWYDVCGPSPYGAVPYTNSQQFNYVTTNNTGGFVYDAQVVIPSVMVPSLPTINFGWAKTDCSSAATRKVGPDFTTDDFAFHNMDFRRSTAFVTPTYDTFAEGHYWLCMQFTQTFSGTSHKRLASALAVSLNSYYKVGYIWIGAPQHYSININSLVSLVPTVVLLQQDLYYSYLAGTSTNSNCDPLDTTTTMFSPVAGDNKSAIFTHVVSTNASRTLCARGPVNGTVLPIGDMRIYLSEFIYQAVESACTTFLVGFSSPNSKFAGAADSVVTLVRDASQTSGACCPSGGVSSLNLLSTSARVPGTTPVHSFYVAHSEILSMNGIDQFSLCYSSSTLGICMQAGRMNVSSMMCSTTYQPTPATTDANAIPLANGASLFQKGIFTEDGVHDWAILAAILFFILLVILIYCCLQCWRRGVVPADEKEHERKDQQLITEEGAEAGEDGGEPTAADSFALLFEANRTRAAVDHSALTTMSPRGLEGGDNHLEFYALTAGLAIGTDLNICHEPTNETLATEAEERREREDIQLCEQFLFEKLRRGYVTELKAQSAVALGADRGRIIREGNTILREARERFCDIEGEARAEIERQEQEEMYELACMDSDGYREIAGQERDALNAVWAGEEESWSARRQRLLRSGHGRAIDMHDEEPFGVEAAGGSSPSRSGRFSPRSGTTSSTTRFAAAGVGAGVGAFSPSGGEEDTAPPPPMFEGQQSSGRSSRGFVDASLPSGPQPSPPPLAIRGDPLLHFTVPAPQPSMMQRGLPSPSATGSNTSIHQGATPFRDPFHGMTGGSSTISGRQSNISSPQRSNPLHAPLTPSQQQHAAASAQYQHSGVTPPHVVEEQQPAYYNSGGGGHQRGEYADDIFYPSHASRPAQQQQQYGAGVGAPQSPGVRFQGGGNINSNVSQQYSPSSYGNNSRRGMQDPSDNDIYRAPRR